MENTTNFFSRPLQLLPTYFKKIGLGVIVASIAVSLFFKFLHLTVSPEKKEIIKHGLKDAFLIGLMFIAFAKDKVEDELTQLIRMKAIISAFVYGVTFIICKDIINMIMEEPLEDFESFGLCIQTLFVYLVYYNTAKLMR